MKIPYFFMAIITLSFIGTICLCVNYFQKKIDKIENANILLVSKQEMRLRLVNFKGDVLFEAPVAIGKSPGNKRFRGDMRTPEGIFKVCDIQNSSEWTHDFGDGNGSIKGAYGNYFIRLDVPGHKGIGIHGTHLSESIGTRASEGCIRMKNNDIDSLVKLISVPMTVVITPSFEDEIFNSQKISKI